MLKGVAKQIFSNKIVTVCNPIMTNTINEYSDPHKTRHECFLVAMNMTLEYAKQTLIRDAFSFILTINNSKGLYISPTSSPFNFRP